jgi:hypothetical protein
VVGAVRVVVEVGRVEVKVEVGMEGGKEGMVALQSSEGQTAM